MRFYPRNEQSFFTFFHAQQVKSIKHFEWHSFPEENGHGKGTIEISINKNCRLKKSIIFVPE
jgi:hypothetical protein